jgi:hypothetical protein
MMWRGKGNFGGNKEGVLKKAAVPTPELPAFVAEATSAE